MNQPRTARPRTRTLPLVALAGCAVMVVSEVVERISGGFTPLSYAITIVGFAGLGVAAVVAHLGQRPPDGLLGLVGAVLFAVACALESLADIIGFGIPGEAELQARTGPIVPVSGVLLVLGGLALGAAMLRAGRYPRWTGVLVALMPLALPATTFGLPVPVLSLTNSLLALALGVAALAQLRPAR